ncbi:serine/threonine-protein kinase MARK1-like [Bombina bombina]|uniref:serine/threonine-protein kinase MARK1-like n=1 Tax=Bombina bombina TaxID=8345 RepID=UPI00235A5AD3|nr:serine/threonine-protein kinase MARK1-like [Bombina bombina]
MVPSGLLEDLPLQSFHSSCHTSPPTPNAGPTPRASSAPSTIAARVPGSYSILQYSCPLSALAQKCLLHQKYHFVRTLGHGISSEVKLAHNIHTRQEVAIKICNTSEIFPSSLEQIHNEVEILKRINHPNIVTFYDAFHEADKYYIVMDYVNGGDLFDHLNDLNGPMTEDVARPIFHQVATALLYLHQNGIVHRDVKPKNILLDSSKKNIKLTDFGLSTFHNNENISTYCGTPYYVAPELYRQRPYDGLKSDVWSAGATLHMMLTNSFAISEFDLKAIAAKKPDVKYQAPQTLTSDCRRLLKKMLHFNPSKRWSLEQILKSPWAAKAEEDQTQKPDTPAIDSALPSGCTIEDIHTSPSLNGELPKPTDGSSDIDRFTNIEKASPISVIPVLYDGDHSIRKEKMCEIREMSQILT